MRQKVLLFVLVVACVLGTFALVAGAAAADQHGKCGHGEHSSTQTGGVCVPNGP
jgi:hypothetical protein